MFTRHTWLAVLISVIAATVVSIAFSDSPPTNTIPIIADRPNFDEIDVDLFCLLSWMYFDVLQCGDEGALAVYNKMVGPATATGMFIGISPAPIQRWGHWSPTWAARLSENEFSSATAYGRPLWRGKIAVWEGEPYMGADSIQVYFDAEEFRDSLRKSANIMEDLFGSESCVWFYNTFDEAPARQWYRMIHDSVYNGVPNLDYYVVDDYIPNMFTQSSDSVWRPELTTQDSLWLPTLEEVDPTGTFSWLKYEVEKADTNRTVACVFSMLHTIPEGDHDGWAGEWNYKPNVLQIPGTFHDQANAVRSYLNMEYQGWGDPLPIPKDNFPKIFQVDAYPFRHVGVGWLDLHEDIEHEVNDSLDTWMLEHYEEGLDSTFIPVRQTALDQERDIPVIYWAQAFGRAGGVHMWNQQRTELVYTSYCYRIPTPAEFLMNCNIALMRGAKGILPYCMITYVYQSVDNANAGHLDQNNLPFDAPYEEWVYSDRLRSDYYMIPPDSYPPFMDSPDDFDPLWDLPARPDTSQSGDRAIEDILVWKFAAYARLWNSMRDTFAQIATVAPELSKLWWWEGYENAAWIGSIDSTWADPFVQPEIRVFKRDGSDRPYLFYVNRQCRQTTNPMEIEIDDRDMPVSADFSELAFDHSRRFIIPVTGIRTLYSFEDTLEAGQARLVEFIDITPATPADIRITQPDISARGPGAVQDTYDFRFVAGADIDIKATFYNMGTSSASNVEVTLTHLPIGSLPEELDSDHASFSGLSTDGYECDAQTITFDWNTDNSDTGVFILEIAAESLVGEPDTDDNSTRIVVQLLPRDYAKTVLENEWDMNEPTPCSNDWHTYDIDSLSGWTSSFCDSISGMFEGNLSDPSSANAMKLRKGSGSSEWIDTDTYQYFSLAGISEETLDIILHWIDRDDNTHEIDIGEDLVDEWTVIGPVNLDDITNGAWTSNGDAKEVWLEFSNGSRSTPTWVRIGWVKLTE